MNNLVNILLVEDDEVDAEAVVRGFQKCRIDNPITRAKDGIEALDILRGNDGKTQMPSPYLLLVDLNMPKLDGIGLIKAIRDNPELKQAIVFVLTTSKSEQDKYAAYTQNVAGYLLKSNVGEDFTRLVHMLDRYWQAVEFPVM